MGNAKLLAKAPRAFRPKQQMHPRTTARKTPKMSTPKNQKHGMRDFPRLGGITTFGTGGTKGGDGAEKSERIMCSSKFELCCSGAERTQSSSMSPIAERKCRNCKDDCAQAAEEQQSYA